MGKENYWKHIKSLAETSVEWAEDEDDLHDSVWEAIDGSEYVIYTSKNLDALKKSRSDPGELTRSAIMENEDWRDVLQAMAFDVMRKDVMEEVERIKEDKLDEVA